jgi:hypothetical protein
MARRAAALIAALALGAPASAAAPAANLKPVVLHVVGGTIYAGAQPLVLGAQPSWSPDGSQFAFSRNDQIWIANADGSGTRRVADGTEPAWSPDGAQIVFVRDGGMFILTINGATKAIRAGDHPTFASDGRLAYDVDGTIYAGLTPLVLGIDPAWSPDAQSLAFVRDGELFTMASDGTGEQQLTTGRADVTEPTWSPAGTRIAFVSGGAVQVLDLSDNSIEFLARGSSPDWANVPVARELLPDLDQWAPTDVYVARHGSRRVLAFQSAVENIGRGPVWIEGRRKRAQTTMTAWQLLRRSDGTVRRLPSAGYLRYDVAPTHSHWHFHPFERYELWKPGGKGALARDHKQGFCFGDRHPVTRAARPHFRAGDCGLYQPKLLSVQEGTSVGYVDIYPPEFHGQWIDITGIPDGRYVLVHRVNPEFALRERSYTNNEASVLVDLRGGGVRVLKVCPGSANCG